MALATVTDIDRPSVDGADGTITDDEVPSTKRKLALAALSKISKILDKLDVQTRSRVVRYVLEEYDAFAN